jgi:hypothetical protein
MVELRYHVATRVGALFILLVSALASAQKPSSEDVNKANNPLTPAITVNFQDQGQPKLYDLDQGANSFLLRGVLPHKLFGLRQIVRFTLPTVTTPDGTGGMTTGLGDLNLFDLAIFPLKKARMAVGFGPQLTLPTATEMQTGTGKWQAGFAAVAVAPRKWGIAGTLLTWQHSFAGDNTRPEQNGLVFQPLFIFNLPNGYYLRSTASWNFDLDQSQYAIPIGTGAGKVWILHSGTSVNAFAEPQWTVAHDGSGQPKFQVFAGLNLQFPIGKK